MDNMKTIKQYADYAGVTVQSVYRRLQTPVNAAALEGHIIKAHGSTYLDEYAVRYLNENRAAAFAASPAAKNERIISELAMKNQELQAENEAMRDRLLETLERLTAATQAAADSRVELADTRGRLQLLEAKSAAADAVQEKLEQAEKEAEDLRARQDQELQALQARQDRELQALQARQDRELQDLQDQLDQERQEMREKLEQAEAETVAAQAETMDLQDQLREADEENRKLQESFQEADEIRNRAELTVSRLQAQVQKAVAELREEARLREDREAELERLKNRSFWDRLFNR